MSPVQNIWQREQSIKCNLYSSLTILPFVVIYEIAFFTEDGKSVKSVMKTTIQAIIKSSISVISIFVCFA